MIASLLSFAALAAAVPVRRQTGPTDVQILNYALTLEHLENAFYKAAITNFTAADFQAAGTTTGFYGNLQEISLDEQTHVDFLSGALGSAATKPCTYAFPVTDATSFLAVANILEGVGVSAYLGAAQFIANKDYLTAAGSILTVEARHSAYIRQQNTASPFPSPFDIPLDFDEVYSLAAQFITACPDTNPALPVKAFPAVSASPGTPALVGDNLSLTVASSVDATAAYFITTTGPVSAPLQGSGTSYTVTVPSGVQNGQEYLVLTKDTAKPSDDNIVAGPAVIMIADNVQNPPTSSAAPTSSATPSSYPTQSTPAPVSEQPDGQPTSGPVSEMPDGQPVSQIGDGQVQAPAGPPVTQIGDGQVQAPAGPPVTQIGDGQVQAPAGPPVTQIGDGQVQAPAGPPVTQIGDGQVQAPAGPPVTQIGDGQVQVQPVQEMPDGQPTSGGSK